MTRYLEFAAAMLAVLALWTVLTAEFAADVKRAERWLIRLFLPAAGTHSDPAETGPQPRLDPTPSGGQAVLGDRMIADVRAEHPRYGRLLDTPPEGLEARRPDGVIRVGAHERVITRKPVSGHPPWTGSQPALTPEAEAERERVNWVRSQLPGNPADVTREDLERAMASLRAMPVYGEKPVAAVLEAERQPNEAIA